MILTLCHDVQMKIKRKLKNYKRFQNIFDYQPSFNMLSVKRKQRHWICYRLEMKGLYSPGLISLYTVFLHNIKRFGYKIGIEFNKSVSIFEQNNCLTKIAYIVYDLINWPRNLLNLSIWWSSFMEFLQFIC